MSGEERAAARAIDLRWHGRPVGLLAVHEAAGMVLRKDFLRISRSTAEARDAGYPAGSWELALRTA